MMYHISLGIDDSGWCFHNNAKQIAPRCSDFATSDICTVASASTAATARKPDLMVAFWHGDGVRLKGSTGTPKLLTCLYDHVSHLDPKGGGGFSESFKVTLKQSAGLVVANKTLMAELLACADAPLPQLFLCPDGVDTYLFKAQPFPPNDLYGGWVGKSDRMAGPGRAFDHKGANLVKQIHQSTGVGIRILDASTGEPWPLYEMPEFYQQISFYVCASLNEGTPNPVLEAMASGRPVISTKVGIASEVITNGVNGFLVDRTQEAINRAVFAMEDAYKGGHLAAMGAAARAAIIDGEWSWDLRIRAWRHAIQTCLGASEALSPLPAVPVVTKIKDPLIIAAEQGRAPRARIALKELLPEQDSNLAIIIPGEKADIVPGAEPRPSALLISDQAWAFYQNMLDLNHYCKNAFDFDHWHVLEWYQTGNYPVFDKYDVIFRVFHQWYLEHLLPMHKVVGSCRSDFMQTATRAPANETDIQDVNACKAFHVVTQKMYNELVPHCPNVVYLTNPVNHERFPEAVNLGNRVIASWNGNASHNSAGMGVDVKGFYSIVTQACGAAGVELSFAEFATRKLTFGQMPAFYHEGNVSLSASLYEGASNSIMESMCAGHAVVTTDAGNIREMQESQIRHLGETGIIIVPRSISAFAEALNKLKSDPAKVKAMGLLNREEITTRWSWEVWSDRYAAFLKMGLL